MDENSADFIQSLAKGLSVISSFSHDHSAMTISEVASLNNLSRASARRILLTLGHLGYVLERNGTFSLGPKTLSLGYGYLSSSSVAEIIARHISRLSASTSESASAAVLEGAEVVYVARSASTRIVQVRISIGSRFPAASTSLGRVLLAGLTDQKIIGLLENNSPSKTTEFTKTNTDELLQEISTVRANGFSVVNQELELGLTSIAVPVRDGRGSLIAAVNLATLSNSANRQSILELLPQLQNAVKEIEEELSHL